MGEGENRGMGEEEKRRRGDEEPSVEVLHSGKRRSKHSGKSGPGEHENGRKKSSIFV
jgi:hypothetical protein